MEWWEQTRADLRALLPAGGFVERWDALPLHSKAESTEGLVEAFGRHWRDWQPVLGAALETAELEFHDLVPEQATPGTANPRRPGEAPSAGAILGEHVKAVEVEGIRDIYSIVWKKDFDPKSDPYFCVNWSLRAVGQGYIYWTSRELLDEVKEALRGMNEFRCGDQKVQEAVIGISRFAELEEYRKASGSNRTDDYPIRFHLMKVCYILVGLGEAVISKRTVQGRETLFFRVL